MGDIEIDNNAVERASRPLTLGRKNWLFAGSDDGGVRAAGIMTLIETAKLNGVEASDISASFGRMAPGSTRRVTMSKPTRFTSTSVTPPATVIDRAGAKGTSSVVRGLGFGSGIPVGRLGPAPSRVAPVEADQRAGNAPFLAAKAMVVLGVVAGSAACADVKASHAGRTADFESRRIAASRQRRQNQPDQPGSQ